MHALALLHDISLTMESKVQGVGEAGGWTDGEQKPYTPLNGMSSSEVV